MFWGILTHPCPGTQTTGDEAEWNQVSRVCLRRYSSVEPLDTMDDPKNIKDKTKEEQIKQELTDHELKGVTGGDNQIYNDRDLTPQALRREGRR